MRRSVGKLPKRAWPLHRAISTSHPVASSSSTTTPPAHSRTPSWKPALEPGILPAYDLALEYLTATSSALLSRRDMLLSQAGQAGHSAEEKRDLEEEADAVEFEALRNDPGIVEAVKTGMADMGERVQRLLVEHEWRRRGRLGRLMETAHRMRVFPDLLPDIDPSVDLRVLKPGSTVKKEADFLTEAKVEVTPGSNHFAHATLEVPAFAAQAFHPEERLYTLLIVDPDVPDATSHSYRTFLHLLIPNIPLSATSPLQLALSSSDPLVPYIPPHPARGSPIHRYTALLLRQSSPLDATASPLPSRHGFSVREWVESTGSEPAGVAFWTGIWVDTVQDREAVSHVYTNILKVPEPRYGPAPMVESPVKRMKHLRGHDVFPGPKDAPQWYPPSPSPSPSPSSAPAPARPAKQQAAG